MKRTVSYSEVATVLDCQAKHDFSYVGQLAGSALERREPHIRLREGRAWGRAVAALHGCPLSTSARDRYGLALPVLAEALAEDSELLKAAGVYDAEAAAELEIYMAEVLWHYAYTSEPLELTHPELELLLPIPSRNSARASSRYDFHAYLDGLARHDGYLWIVEYKLRGRLTGAAQVALGRQYRFYAWAAERTLGEEIAGVIVDERLNEVPKPPRLLKPRKAGDPWLPSHAKDQHCTRQAYEAACLFADVTPHPETLEALSTRKWQDRQRVIFSRSELADVELELQSASKLISQLDSGQLYPLRNPSPMRCPGCAFRDICQYPRDTELVDTQFARVPAKRDRQEAIAA
jgi:hypothetical protein